MSFSESELEPGASDQSGEHPAHKEPEHDPTPPAHELAASEQPAPDASTDATLLSAEAESPAATDEVSTVRAAAHVRSLSLSDLLAATERAAEEAERTAQLGVSFTFESEDAAALVDAFHEADPGEHTLVDELTDPGRSLLDPERSAAFDAAASLFMWGPFAEPTNPSPAKAPEPAPPAPNEASAPRRKYDLFERYEHLLTAPEDSEFTSHAILAAVDSAMLAAPSSVKPAAVASVSDATDRADASARLDLERDVDWSEDPPAVALVSDMPAPTPNVIEAPLAAVAAPVVALPEAGPARPRKERRPRRKTSPRPSWPAFAVAVAAAAALGFSGGFFSGRGSAPALDKHLAAAQPALSELPSTAPAALSENVNSGPLASLAETAEPAAEVAPAAARNSATPPSTARTSQNPSAPFDTKAAQAALDRAAARAGVCVPAGEPGGSAVATVTFAKSGRVTGATLSSAEFAGSYSSDCIRKILSEAKVRPFTGEPVTVRRTVRVQ